MTGGGVADAAAATACARRRIGWRHARVETRTEQTADDDLLERAACCCVPASPIRERRRARGRRRRRVAASDRRELERDAQRATDGLRAATGAAVAPDADSRRSTSPIFLTVTLLILMSATWLGLYLAKRITRPVQQLAEGARAIGAGQLDVRLEPETGDELGSLVEAFNMMAAELQTSREKLEQSRRDLERKNLEVDARRRYIETILERVATGVISLDAAGRILDGQRRRRAPARPRRREPRPAGARRVRSRGPCSRCWPLVDAVEQRGRARPRAGDHADARRSRDPPGRGGDGADRRRRPRRGRGAGARRRDAADSRAARRGLARRRAAARARDQEPADADPAQRRTAAPAFRRRAAADAGARRRMHRRDHHRGRGAQGARRRVRAVRAAARAAHGADRSQPARRRHAGALRRRAAARHACESSASLAAALPPVRLDAEQIRQVIINLVDNAIEALGGPGAPAPERRAADRSSC